MERRESLAPVPAALVEAATATALTLVYSAPTPGAGSRYVDGPVAHEVRLLTVSPVRDVMAGSGTRGVGETVLGAVTASRDFAGYADLRAAGYLAPLARAALLGEPAARVLRSLGREDLASFGRALGVSGYTGPLVEALRMASGAGREATLRDAVRFTAGRDALAREYARDYEVTRGLAEPALLDALGRAVSARGALVQSYLEVLAEVPDPDIADRAGSREAEDVSRMANGVIKSGGVHSRRGIQALSNLDGILRADARLRPSATEPPVVAAAFLLTLEHGPGALSSRLRPATGGSGGR